VGATLAIVAMMLGQVLLHEEAARIDAGGLRPLRHADPPPCEVAGRAKRWIAWQPTEMNSG